MEFTTSEQSDDSLSTKKMEFNLSNKSDISLSSISKHIGSENIDVQAVTSEVCRNVQDITRPVYAVEDLNAMKVINSDSVVTKRINFYNEDNNVLTNSFEHGTFEGTGSMNVDNGVTNAVEHGYFERTGSMKVDNGLTNAVEHLYVENTELMKATNWSSAKEENSEKSAVCTPRKDPSSTKLSNCNSVEDPVKSENCDAMEGHGMIVAAHYNALEEKGLSERSKSRIVHLRNFNNWIKSMLISEYIDLIKQNKSHGSPIRVMDMCCGKGGDLLKWRNSDIKHLVCADIAETSVEQCKIRYEDMSQRQRRERRYQQLFTAEFLVADCTKVRLREKYKDASLELDLVSCQFSFHYCFESLPQTECMLRNAAECLRTGGFFIGTIPDSNEIVKRFRENGSKPLGNKVHTIEFEKSEEPFPLFGAKYNFSLMDVVNCPEFLVHFPTLERLARKHGLELVAKDRFENYFLKHKEKGRGLLGKMQALESYPPFDGTSLHGEEEEYLHAKEVTESNGWERVGTMSRSEWEATSLYMVFAFRKMKRVSFDAEGRPVYEEPQTTEKKAQRNVEQPRDTEEPSSKRLKADDTT